MLIGALADATGLSAKTLRYWEAEGLLHEAARTDGGYRDYPDNTVDRVAFIRHAQAAGLTVRQIGEIVAIRDGGHAPCGHAADLVHERLTEVEARLQDLEQTRTALRALRGRLRALDPADCDPPLSAPPLRRQHVTVPTAGRHRRRSKPDRPLSINSLAAKTRHGRTAVPRGLVTLQTRLGLEPEVGWSGATADGDLPRDGAAQQIVVGCCTSNISSVE